MNNDSDTDAFTNFWVYEEKQMILLTINERLFFKNEKPRERLIGMATRMPLKKAIRSIAEYEKWYAKKYPGHAFLNVVSVSEIPPLSGEELEMAHIELIEDLKESIPFQIMNGYFREGKRMTSEKKEEIRTAFNRMNRAEFQEHFIKTNPHRSKEWLAREWDSVMERRYKDRFEVWPNPWGDAHICPKCGRCMALSRATRTVSDGIDCVSYEVPGPVHSYCKVCG